MKSLELMVQDTVDEAREGFYAHPESDTRREWYAAVVNAANEVLGAEWIGPSDQGCTWDESHVCGCSGRCAGEKSSAPTGCEFMR